MKILKNSTVEQHLFSSYLPYLSFIDEGIILTKDNALLTSFNITPNDFSYKSDFETTNAVNKINKSFSFINEKGFYLYIDSYTKKTREKSENYSLPKLAKDFNESRNINISSFFYTDVYLTIVYVLPKKKKFNSSKKENSLKNDLFLFKNKTADFFNRISDKDCFKATRVLNSTNLLTFLHNCFGKNVQITIPKVGFYIDSYLSDCVFTNGMITKINDEYIFCLSVNLLPSETHASLFTQFLNLPIEFRISTRFQFLGEKKAKTKANEARQMQMLKRIGIGNLFFQSPHVNTNREELAEEANLIKNKIDADHYFSIGYLTTLFVLKSSDLQKLRLDIDALTKEMHRNGFLIKEETENNPYAFLGSLPGNISYNKRRNLISLDNLSHLIPCSLQWQGTPFDVHLKNITGVSAPNIKTRSGSTLFNLNLNVGDVGHTLVVGPTGSGKSIFLNTLALQFLKYPKARVVFFDKDASSRFACYNVSGVFYDFSDGGAFNDNKNLKSKILLNPFSNLSNNEILNWLSQFLSDFFSMRKIDISPSDEIDIRSALESMRNKNGRGNKNSDDWSFESFYKYIQNEKIRLALTPFLPGKEFSEFFFSQSDDFETSYWTTFEMSGLMDKRPELVQFILGYLFFKLETTFSYDPVLLILDEAWLFLDNTFFGERIKNWLKTLRKKNVYVVMATQDIEDTKTKIFSTILNQCKTKIFLPNSLALEPGNRESYEGMGLNISEITALKEAESKRDYFYSSELGSQLFTLDITPTQLSILTTYKDEEERVVG